MKMTTFFIGMRVLLLYNPSVATAQEEFDYKEAIGFACGYSGEPTPIIEKLERMVKKGKYEKVVKVLESGTEKEKVLYAAVLMELDRLVYYELTSSSRQIIEGIREIQGQVFICQGCLGYQRLLYEELFDGQFSEMIESWLITSIKK